MKNTKKFLIPLVSSLALLMILVIPIVSFAEIVVDSPEQTQTPPPTTPNPVPEENSRISESEREPQSRPGLVQCGRGTIEITDSDGRKFTIADPADACNFDELIYLINNIINWILFGLAIPVAGIMFAYAGFTLITAGGDNSGARTKAKEIFLNAVIGFTLAFLAYIIVKLVLKTLGYDGGWIGF